MKSSEYRVKVHQAMEEAMRSDKEPSIVSCLSVKFGLMEITRQGEIRN